MRDSQKQKVYRAEAEMGHKDYDERELEEIHDVHIFIRTVLNNIWVRMDFGEFVCQNIRRNITIKETRRRSWALAYPLSICIELPYKNWAWNKIVLLHELAHIITTNLWITTRIAQHGPEFCWVYLRLLQHCEATDVGKLMQRLFELHRVSFYKDTPPYIIKKRAACKKS